MNLDILNKQAYLWKEENKLQKRGENLPAAHTNVVVFTTNRNRDIGPGKTHVLRFVVSLFLVTKCVTLIHL